MKVFKYLTMLVAAMTISFAVTSCGDDDETLKPGGSDKDKDDEIEVSPVDRSANLMGIDNKLILTLELYRVYTSTLEATFNDDSLCTRCICTEIYRTPELADEGMKDWAGEDEKNITRDGCKITIDMTDEVEGTPYEEVFKWFELERDEFLNPEH